MSRELPGHATPYAFTPAEIETFLAVHRGEPALSAYLWSKDPPYGIIVKDGYGDILVWFDASAVLHVIDVTNMSIAQQVQQAPFSSPDSSIIESLIHQIEAVVTPAAGMVEIALLVAAGFLVLSVVRKF